MSSSSCIHYVFLTTWEHQVNYLLVALGLMKSADVEGTFESSDNQPIVRKDPPLVLVVLVVLAKKGNKRIPYFGDCHSTRGELFLRFYIELDSDHL